MYNKQDGLQLPSYIKQWMYTNESDLHMTCKKVRLAYIYYQCNICGSSKSEKAIGT